MATDDAGDGGDDGIPTALLIVLILLVAVPVGLVVLVIGTAVIGAFVLGFGSGMEGAPEAPSVQWDSTADADAGTMTFTHQSGDEVLEGDVLATVNGDTAEDWETSDGTLSRGDTVTVRGLQPGDEVRLVWVAGDTRQTLASHTV